MAFIKLSHVSKSYKQQNREDKILVDLNLEIKKGELVAVMGPSGSGKSTLLNILGCLDTCTSGRYDLDGMNISQQSSRTLAEIRNQKIGFVFQQFNLLSEYTVFENLEIPFLYKRNKKRAEKLKVRQRILDHLRYFDLFDLRNKKPKFLSGGQQQRVAIARAMVNNPELILADEPTGALDIENGNRIMKYLKHINKNGKTVIIVTHDPKIAQKCESIFYLEDGRLQLQPPQLTKSNTYSEKHSL